MPDEIDLTGFADAINGALERGRAVVVAAVDEDGHVSQSMRGSTHVYSRDQLAIWARKRDEGLAASVAKHPDVSVFYFDSSTSPSGIRIHGSAHTDGSLNDAVYAGIPEREREQDPEKKGIAIIVDVDWLSAFGRGFPGVVQSR